jgi:hypothetical protein
LDGWIKGDFGVENVQDNALKLAFFKRSLRHAVFLLG